MKPFKICSFFFLILFASLTTFAQKIRVVEGDRDVLKNETSINIELTFDNLSVGKYDKEEDYIKAKKEEFNKKEPGRGDTWEKRWNEDKDARFDPDFQKLFQKNSNMTLSKEAKYTLIFHTTSIEPGFNIGITRKSAKIDGEALIVETANKTKVVAKLTVDNSPGNVFMGNDYDPGERISEAYAKAGKELGKYLK